MQQDALGVFREDVVLEIHPVAGAQVAEIGLRAGVGNDPYAEAVGIERCNGERHAVDGDRALQHEILGGTRRQLEDEAEIRAEFAYVEDSGGIVDMALYEVAAEAGIRRQGALEIHPGAWRELAEIRAGEGLVEEV